MSTSRPRTARIAVADGGTTPKVHDGWMWDLTVPGNNDHDFYIKTAVTAVLVHNCSKPRVYTRSQINGIRV